MVVVYSGDSDRPAPDWEAESTPRGPALEGAKAHETGPFLPVKDFRRSEMPSGPGLFDALLVDEARPAEEIRRVEVPPEPESEPEPEPELEAKPGLEPVPSPPQAEEPAPPPPVALPTTPVRVEAEAAATDARNRPTVRVGRVQSAKRAPSVAPGPQRAPSVAPGPRSPSMAPGASVAPASIHAAKALAARRQLSGRPSEPVKPAGVPRGLLLGLLGIAACLGLFLVQRARSRDALALESAPLAAVVQPSRATPAPLTQAKSAARSAVASPSALPSEPSASPSALASASPPAAASESEAPAPAPAPAASVASSTRTVNLLVVPPDAKVFTRGLMRKGPPFVFEIRPGAHLAVEVVRDGYVARRVVLDGTKSDVAVGLMRKRTSAAAARGRAESAATGSADGPEERGTVVQSGL